MVQELVGDVLDQAAAELGGAAGDGEVGVDGDLGGVRAGGGELGGDAGGRGAVAATVLALGLDHRVVIRRIALREGAVAGVLQGHRPELDLARAGELVAVVRRQGGAGETRHHPFEVVERGPGLLDRGRYDELVLQLHEVPAAARTARRVSTVARCRR